VASDVADIVVRAVETEREIATYHRVMVASFSSGSDTEIENAALEERRQIEALPEFQPRQRRGAFRGDTYLGGYIIFERGMRVGASALRTGCIGGVGVDRSQRRQGVATALMGDALAFAEERHLALLLLDGIPNFYHRFGYVDVADSTDQVIDRTVIEAWSGDADTTRYATIEDAGALLDLFNRHWGPITGSFARSLEGQTARLSRSLTENNPPVVAVDGRGAIRGYLYLRQGNRSERAAEVAADTWSAALALLRHHEQHLSVHSNLSPVVEWPLPPGSTTHLLLVDHLTAPDTWKGDSGSRRWAVRGQTYQRRNAGWMARVVSVRQLVEDLQPAWRARLATSSLRWHGVFELHTEAEGCAIELNATEARSVDDIPLDAPIARLPFDSLVQAVFGYRPISYLATRPGSNIPNDLLPILNVLFPMGQPWIPGSDAF
jgi:predicted N-acetyltransferase YhbS